ncbi:NAD(P)-dependent oxidoreductase [Streptomyces sp. SAJ15]|uniref:NAD(P)-dependent oxidoreductase n=1 Tax=Streptomyces sp. SAJ15 TaxID=2011095 RepID=UPI001185C417|nr:NAD(P)-binding domain-containing protein [Streptomyces sp. SAJ15]TVL92860.1 6-phosphogluconate dehydrogenase [Streptomyces sp. SAJ15]
MANEEHTPVTVIGLGLMGTALADAFLAAGHPTTVWNRSPHKADALVARGATRAGSVAEAVAAGPLVIVCVLDYDAVDEVLDAVSGDAADGALAGTTLVNLTNGTPRQARAMAARVAERGGAYLDGGIMAVPQGIATPAALLLYSGAEDAFQRYEKELSVLGAAVHVSPDPGLASLQDLAMLSAMYGMFAGYFQAVALVSTEGVPATGFTSLLVPFLNAMVANLPESAREIDSGAYTSQGSSLEMQVSAYRTMSQVAADQGMDAELIAPVLRLIERRVADGFGHQGLSSLVELVKPTA